MKHLSYADTTSLKVIFFFLLLVFSIPYYFYAGGSVLGFISVLVVSSFVNSCHSISWHRWLCHRTFTPHVVGKYLMLFSTAIQGNNRPLFQIAAHRLHHRYPDSANDPHSPRDRNFFQAWLGRFKADPDLLTKELHKDDFKNKELMFIQRHFYKIFFVFYTVFMLIDVKTAILFAAWSYTYMNTATAAIAHYSHYTEDGVTYKTRNMPRIWSSLCSGEGLHLNHHNNPRSWTFASEDCPVDPGARFAKRFLMKHPN